MYTIYMISTLQHNMCVVGGSEIVEIILNFCPSLAKLLAKISSVVILTIDLNNELELNSSHKCSSHESRVMFHQDGVTITYHHVRFSIGLQNVP